MPRLITRVAVLTKVRDLGGNVLAYSMPARRRIGRHNMECGSDPERVPEFDGDSASFEIGRVREPGCPWPRWRVLRRVPES